MAKKLLRLFLIFAPLVALGVAANWFYRVADTFTDSKHSVSDVISAMRDPRGEFPNTSRMTLLLVGQDYNHDNKGNQYSKNTRADTIMLMSVDLDNKKLSAVSIPRDTKVRASDGKTGKINGTYARGGIELLKSTIEETFDITIDHYVIIRPDAVKRIVDSVGGIDVETIDEMNYDDSWANLHIHLPAGPQRLNGQQAVGFVRFREVNRYRMDSRGRMIPLRGVKSSKEEGDLRRIARQQQFIRALMNEANRPSNVWNASAIIKTGFDQIETSFTKVQVLALAGIFKGSSGESMGGGTIPGTDDTSTGAYYYVMDEERAKATIDWLLKGDDTAAKKLCRVSIKNSTKVKGAAKAAADILDEDGYNAQSEGNDPVERLTTEVVYYKAANESQAKAIQAMLGIPSVRKEVGGAAYTGPDITIVIGTDVAQTLLDRAKNRSSVSR